MVAVFNPVSAQEDSCFLVEDSVMSEPACLREFRRRLLRWPAAGTATRPGGGETHSSPFPDEVAFEFRESTEDGEEGFATGGGGVDRFGQRFEADGAGGEIFDGLQQVGERTTQPVQMSRHHRTPPHP